MEQQKLRNVLLIVISVLLFSGVVLLSCMLANEKTVSVVSIQKTDSTGLEDVYTISYSNGTTSQFTITNGKDGEAGQMPTILDIYNEYKNQYGSDISYADFIKAYVGVSADNSVVINQSLLSCMKVYSEFKVTQVSGFGSYQQSVRNISISCGSAVIYRIDDDFTYIITNYHVVYSSSANAENGSNIAYKINGYVYGSEGAPQNSGNTDNGYPVYTYDAYAIPLTYVGGSINHDIAILKANTADIKAINENIKAITFADNYYVGETAIAIGNPENAGISATEGVVSVDNEYISLDIDGTARTYRSIRMDTAIYGGSSGGGLFNLYGKLIGLTNAGDQTDQNINYAIPVDIVKGATENILANYDGTTPTTVKKITLGLEVTSTNSKYVYDKQAGYGMIYETINVSNVTENSIANIMGLQSGDIINSIVLNGNETKINRNFEMGDLLLQVREGNAIIIKFTRAGEVQQTSTYIVKTSDLS